jgi:phosphohistidine phosphatase SixA
MVTMIIIAAGCASHDRVLDELRAGGVVLYMRHGVTDTPKDGLRGDYADCTWQRNLSADARKQAKDVGAAIAALRLPIESVISSPMCRAMDTARLVFGDAKPETRLLGGRNADGTIDLSPIKQFSGRAPSSGRIAAIVGHESPGLGFEPMLIEGEAAVIRPDAQGYRIVGRVRPHQWVRWAEGLRSR